MVGMKRYLRAGGYFICSLILAGGILEARISAAATFYVATTGSDANPGTEENPFLTLNKGVTVLKPGDTLYLRSGIYAESLRNKIAGGTSWSAPVKVAAFPGETVTLRPALGTNVLWLSGTNRRYIVIEGLIIDGSNVSSNGIKIDSGDGTVATAAHHIRIKDVEVMNAPNQGILVSRYCDDNEFLNLHVHHNGTDLTTDHGIYIQGSRNLIRGGQWHHNKRYGIHLYQYGMSNVVSSARIYGNTRGIISSQQADNLITNNLVYQNTDRGILLANGNNLKVYNNTVYNNGQYGIELNSSGVTNAQVRNNIAFGHITNIRNIGTNTTLSHNLFTDPQFANAALYDLHLQATSPAIDAGVTLSEVTEDYAQVSRPQGVAYDIGAYEYTDGIGGQSLSGTMRLRITGTN
jgi:parallel beta-helix repeat protein